MDDQKRLIINRYQREYYQRPYVKAKKPLGTAGQLKSAQKYLDDDFLCIYSDSLFNFKIESLIALFFIDQYEDCIK